MQRQPLLQFKRPEMIQVADKPLKLGGKIELVSTKLLQEKLNVQLDDSIYLDPELKLSELKFEESITGSVSSQALKKQIQSLIEKPRDDLVLCNMGKTGYGVFAATDIPANTVIGIYSGTITKNHGSSEDYAFCYYGSDFVMNQTPSRCLASYLQHLPDFPRTKDAKTYVKLMQQYGIEVSETHYRMNMDIFNIELKDSVKKNIAMQNVRTEYLNFNGIPIIAIVTNQLILAHTQLGFNYGADYWLKSVFLPEYFDNKGSQITNDKFKRLFGPLKFSDCSYLGEFKPLIAQLEKKALKIELIDTNKKRQFIPAEEMRNKLIQINALSAEEKSYSNNPFRLLVSLEELPITINLTDQNNKVIDTFSDSVDVVGFHELRKVLGAGVIKKISSATYEINIQWILQVHTHNLVGIEQLSKILGTSQNELVKNIMNHKNSGDKSCLARKI